MFAKAQAYWSIFIVNIKQSFAYRADLLLSVLFSLATAVVMILVWTAVYAASAQTEIMGVGLTTLYVYYLIGPALRAALDGNIPMTIQQDITTGNIAVTLTRPINYVMQVVIGSLGDNFVSSVAVTLPLVIISLFFLNTSITPFILGLFVLELVIAYVITSCIDFILGCLAIYITQIWSLVSINYVLVFVLGGGAVPIFFLTGWLGELLNALPFKFMIYVPAATLLGIGNINPVTTIAEGLAWSLVLLALSVFMWSRVKRDISAVGG